MKQKKMCKNVLLDDVKLDKGKCHEGPAAPPLQRECASQPHRTGKWLVMLQFLIPLSKSLREI